ncbi:MAG TPA: tryptophan--tRNA ligase [Candidatus Saccharimonadales bacterium]|nr:tryptophan--tRNA ligase [Candidatus Saccharimonadales bacterium]
MKLFSGMQPSGDVHLGNYLGAIKNWVELQKGNELMLCVVDLHAITVPQDPEHLRQRTLDLTKLFVACGIDPKKTTIFRQSDVAAHSELAWILSTQTAMGELSRMTQFKDKSQKGGGDSASVGLFTYPVLQAADVLLYGAEAVPVGEDQKQHLELMRDLAERFNNRFGETFVVPEPKINKSAARVMALDNPAVKMSKSAGTNNYISLLDDEVMVAKKIARAVTDSGSDITADEDRAGLYNLLTIEATLTNSSLEDAAVKHKGKGFAEYKKHLAAVINQSLDPIRSGFEKLTDQEAEAILKAGGEVAKTQADDKMTEIKQKIGLN